MKYIRIFLFALFFAPVAAFAATPSNEFMIAAQLLSAAKNADIQQVQLLINNGADVNYVDSTGLSLVCTALMNNDIRAAQILQMYGADASKCDRQIKQYESRNTPESSGGLFSGLSSAQSISLAAAGAAVVVGGLFLLTDWLDPGNENNNGGTGTGGNRPGQGENTGGNSGSGTEAFITGVGPAYVASDNTVSYSKQKYQENLKLWNPSTGGTNELDFNYFRPTVQTTNNYLLDGLPAGMQNYLLIMHGYSSFANGYMGQTTFRNTDSSHSPVYLNNDTGGGKPILTSVITTNGINPAGSASRGDGILYAAGAGVGAATTRVDKYANYLSACTSDGCGAEVEKGFDLSGSGTAMNPFASATDSAPAKIIGGWAAGERAYGDLFGFVPNGQLAIYRTGGGYEWVDVENPTSGASVGTVSKAGTGDSGNNVIAVGDTITLGGKTYTISLANSGGTNPTITVNGTVYKVGDNSTLLKGVCTSSTPADCEGVSDIAIYQGTDGFYYVNTTGKNTFDAVYVVDNNNIYTQKNRQETDIKTFEAIFNARTNGATVVANATLNPESRSASYAKMNDLPSLFATAGSTDKKIVFAELIDKYYEKDSSGSTTQGGFANSMFNGYSSGQPIIVMPAGEFEFGLGDGKSVEVLDATFENYAPALYDQNLERMFMTVVAVQNATGTAAADSIEGYGNGTGSAYGPLYLSAWVDNNGTTDTTDDDKTYMSRKCGIAGLGLNGIDPWCFSAAGPTAEMATASAAGAVAAIKGAFSYLSNPEIFVLLALTADGPYLATNPSSENGTAWTSVNELVAYLQKMYSLPPEYAQLNLTGQDYLDKFAEVYGYGMINLERATTPGKRVYFYDGNNIVSDSGNAYWRAAQNTTFRASSVFSLANETISAPFFDVLESFDGSMTLPRVWKNEFALGTTSKRGLYMGDVLGEFRTRTAQSNRIQFGNFGFSMSMSEKPYADNMNGLDDMRLDYTSGNWNFAAGYQRHFTDGNSRFDGMSNPILAMTSNAVLSDVEYRAGRWSFGARAFSGNITDETTLDNDPTISSQYMPARLGLMQGAQSNVAWNGEQFGFSASFGAAHETNTLLGAVSGGLLNMGNGDTVYADTEMYWSPMENMRFTVRSTFARTNTNATGDFVLGMSDIDSRAFAFGMDIGGFSFSVAQPLTISRGSLLYPYAEYEIVNVGDNKYDITIQNAHIESLDLSPTQREVRFTGAYRHNLGEFTDGAIGFIYRVNPNNTSEFGNESIFMMKLTHRLGI